MKVEIWSDFVCPFCYIGKRRLEVALAQFPHKDQVKLYFKSFELDQQASVHTRKSIYEALAVKYRMSIEQAKKTTEEVAQLAATVDLTFQFEGMKETNTFDAHRLAKFASDEGKEGEVVEALLHAYFTETKNIANHRILTAIAEAVGLDRQKVAQLLSDKSMYASDVREDEALAQQYSIRGVPYFVIENKYVISGAQSIEAFQTALHKAWQAEGLEALVGGKSKAENCTDESCAIKPQRKLE